MISGIRFTAHGLYPVYELLFLTLGLGSLSNDDGDTDENGKKNNRLRLAKQLCTCITLLSTFLCRRCTTTT